MIDNNGSEDDFNEFDEYDDYDDDYDLPDKTDCWDEGVEYRSAKRDRLNTIHKVQNWELCKEMCENNAECNYWTWLREHINRRGKRKDSKCQLKSGIGNVQLFIYYIFEH